MKLIIKLLASGVGLLLAVSARSQENPGVPWSATDALGRALPLSNEVGLPRPNRFVGIFYEPWQFPLTPIPKSPNWNGPFDVSKILACDPQAFQKPASPLWGGFGQFHFWGEPLFGYYRINDPWVLRRHAQMLGDAGVDVLIIDVSNAETYREVYLA